MSRKIQIEVDACCIDGCPNQSGFECAICHRKDLCHTHCSYVETAYRVDWGWDTKTKQPLPVPKLLGVCLECRTLPLVNELRQSYSVADAAIRAAGLKYIEVVATALGTANGADGGEPSPAGSKKEG
jgi:hypothetical protein